jgi:hypothetical protein
MGNVIKINDGYKTYDIVNQDDKLLGSFSFNPSDTNIIHRHTEVVEALEKLELDISAKKDETSLDEAFKAVEAVVYEKINYLLNADVAENFFSIMGPFSPLASGQYFIESVIDAIGQAISAETGARVKKINSKIQKHTSKYHR